MGVIAPAPSSTTGSDGNRSRFAGSIEDLLNPQSAAALEALDVKTRKRFAGRLMGERRSKQRGRSVEFEDYRPYVAGDDLRHIDWNVFARLDRFFIKIFEEEQDLAVHLVMDASASMEAGRPPKLLAAMRIAMAMGYLSLVNQNRVAAWVFTTGNEGRLWAMDPARGREGVQRLGNFLLGAGVEGKKPGVANKDFASAMRGVAGARGAAGGKGVLMLLSDMLIREGYEQGLNYLMSSGPGSGGAGSWDATLVQVLSPGELDPAKELDSAGRRSVIGDLRLTDCESGRTAEVTVTQDLLARYRQRLRAYQEQLTKACAARSIGLVTVESDVNVARLMMEDLRRRGVVG